jgi:hypothetical protein
MVLGCKAAIRRASDIVPSSLPICFFELDTAAANLAAARVYLRLLKPCAGCISWQTRGNRRLIAQACALMSVGVTLATLRVAERPTLDATCHEVASGCLGRRIRQAAGPPTDHRWQQSDFSDLANPARPLPSLPSFDHIVVAAD